MPKCRYTYFTGTLFDHLNFTLDYEIVTFGFLISIQSLVILNKNSRNLLENTMANSQII